MSKRKCYCEAIKRFFYNQFLLHDNEQQAVTGIRWLFIYTGSDWFTIDYSIIIWLDTLPFLSRFKFKIVNKCLVCLYQIYLNKKQVFVHYDQYCPCFHLGLIDPKFLNLVRNINIYVKPIVHTLKRSFIITFNIKLNALLYEISYEMALYFKLKGMCIS